MTACCDYRYFYEKVGISCNMEFLACSDFSELNLVPRPYEALVIRAHFIQSFIQC